MGGNWRIFHEMIAASGAKLYLNTPVFEIERVDHNGKISWKVLSSEVSNIFDGVVLASPYAYPLKLKLMIASFKHFNGPNPGLYSVGRLHDVTCDIACYESTH